jgi:hypothetical protein
MIYRGWGKPPISKKFHFFNNSTTSVCSRVWWGGAKEANALEDTDHNHVENCKQCMKIRAEIDGGKP